jgi:hypothetical protein
MPASHPQSGVSLTGLWHGQFSYPSGAPAEFFRATLLETPEWLSGSTQEVSQFGESKGKTLYATLRGRRDGSAVSFVKTYESQTRSHSVNYAGTLNGDATEIEGIWTVPGVWSGKFLMIRESGIKATIRQGVREAIGRDR